MNQDDTIRLQGSVWLRRGEQQFGGRQLELLARIADCGSITQAAKAVGMSYKAAWEAVDAISNLAGEPLLTRVSGGRSGGYSRLTPRGEKLVDNFRVIEREHRRFLEQLDRQAAGIADDYLLLRRMSVKTSARNQFLGKVAAVQRGAVNDEIRLEIAGGQQLVATVTRTSSDELGLQPGADALALIKASSVILVSEADGLRFSARNRLRGKVARLLPGAVNCEVVLELDGGGALAAIVTQASADTLELASGMDVTAIFKASSVILAVPA